MPRLPITTMPQLRSLKLIKPGVLPEIPEDFNPRKLATDNPKCKTLYNDVSAWVRELNTWLSVADQVTQSETHKQLYANKEANEKFVAKLIRAAHSVRKRCIHSIVHPEMYAGNDAMEGLYVYWQLASQMGPSGRAHKDIEYYTPGKGFSRFFTREAKAVAECPKKNYEFYTLLSRFCNMYSFAYEIDQTVMSLHLDGFSDLVIARVVRKKLEVVQKKIKKYTEIALRHKDMFLEQSEKEGLEPT